MVSDLERIAVEEYVAGVLLGHLDLESATSEEEAKREALEPGGETRGEGERTDVVAHAAEPGHGCSPGSGQRCDVNAVMGVAAEVVEIDEGCLGEIVVGEVEMSDLRGDHRLRARRERGVAHGKSPRSTRSP